MTPAELFILAGAGGLLVLALMYGILHTLVKLGVGRE